MCLHVDLIMKTESCSLQLSQIMWVKLMHPKTLHLLTSILSYNVYRIFVYLKLKASYLYLAAHTFFFPTLLFQYWFSCSIPTHLIRFDLLQIQVMTQFLWGMNNVIRFRFGTRCNPLLRAVYLHVCHPGLILPDSFYSSVPCYA